MLLALLMLIPGLATGISASALEADDIVLAVGSKSFVLPESMKAQEGSGWIWTPLRSRLTLDGMKMSGSTTSLPGFIFCEGDMLLDVWGSNSINVSGAAEGYAAIYVTGELTVKLNEGAELTVTSTVGSAAVNRALNFCGVYAGKGVEIEGAGSLNIDASGSFSGNGCGILAAEGDIELGGKVAAEISAVSSGSSAVGISAPSGDVEVSDEVRLVSTGSCSGGTGSGIRCDGIFRPASSGRIDAEGSSYAVYSGGIDTSVMMPADPFGAKVAGGVVYTSAGSAARRVIFRDDVQAMYGVVVPRVSGEHYYVARPEKADAVVTSEGGTVYDVYYIDAANMATTLRTESGYEFSGIRVSQAKNLPDLFDFGTTGAAYLDNAVGNSLYTHTFAGGRAYLLEPATSYDGQTSTGALVCIDNGSRYSVAIPAIPDETFAYERGTGYYYYSKGALDMTIEAEDGYLLNSITVYSDKSLSDLKKFKDQDGTKLDGVAGNKSFTFTVPANTAWRVEVGVSYDGQTDYGVCLLGNDDTLYRVTNPSHYDGGLISLGDTYLYYYLNGKDEVPITFETSSGYVIESMRIFGGTDIDQLVINHGALVGEVPQAVGKNVWTHSFKPGSSYLVDISVRKCSVTSPTITPAGCTFKDSMTVSMEPTTPGADIRYTLDGSVPNASSRLYTAPFAINASTVVRAVSVLGSEVSADARAEYLLEGSIPSMRMETVRMGGDDRIETALNICSNGWAHSEYVILTDGYSFADALAGVPLAAALGAPILLTAGKSTLEKPVLDKIAALGAKKIIILGGVNAVSKSIENILSPGYQTERIAGDTRFGTAVAIAERLAAMKGSPECVYIAYGYNYPDALSISTVAAIRACPVLYAPAKGNLDADTAAFIRANDCKEAVIIGGIGAVGESVEGSIKAAGITRLERVCGTDRYATSDKVYEEYDHLFTGSGVAVATGASFPDALAGGAFAARNSVPLLLVNGSSPSAYTRELIRSRATTKLFVFGGYSAVTSEAAAWLVQ